METQKFCAADVYDNFPDQLTLSSIEFRSFGTRASFWGPAETLRTFEDHTPVLAAVSQPGEGKVLVVDAGGSRRIGVMGDRLAALASVNGWAGVVIHGAIRDSVAINGIDIGVKALSATARRGWQPTEGIRGTTLDFGGMVIAPGDWIYCDPDAVMVSRDRLDPALAVEANYQG